MTPYLPIIILTAVLFGLLAAILLVPIYRFLRREEEASKHWTPEQLAKRLAREERQTNGHAESEPPRPSGESGAVGLDRDDQGT